MTTVSWATLPPRKRVRPRRKRGPYQGARPGIQQHPDKTATNQALKDRPAPSLQPQEVTHLTPKEVGQVLIGSGWPKNERVVAKGIGVVQCESQGNTKARSDNPSGGKNRGMWQIDSVSHPDVSDNCADNPSCASEWVWKTTHGTNFSQWACGSRNGDEWMSDARAAIAAGPINTKGSNILGGDVNIPNPIPDVAGAIGDIVKFIARLFEPDFWLRVGKAALGFIFLLFGVQVLMKALLGVDISPAMAIPAGRAAKGIKAAAGKG